MNSSLHRYLLSESVSKPLQVTGGEDILQTSSFVSMTDRCLNVNNCTTGKLNKYLPSCSVIIC